MVLGALKIPQQLPSGMHHDCPLLRRMAEWYKQQGSDLEYILKYILFKVCPILGKAVLQKVFLNLGEGGFEVCDCHLQNKSALKNSDETDEWRQQVVVHYRCCRGFSICVCFTSVWDRIE